MKRIALFIAAMFLLACFASNAQQYEPRDSWPYVYENFLEGVVSTGSDDAASAGHFNVVIFDGSLMYIGKDGNVMSADMSRVNSVRLLGYLYQHPWQTVSHTGCRERGPRAAWQGTGPGQAGPREHWLWSQLRNIFRQEHRSSAERQDAHRHQAYLAERKRKIRRDGAPRPGYQERSAFDSGAGQECREDIHEEREDPLEGCFIPLQAGGLHPR